MSLVGYVKAKECASSGTPAASRDSPAGSVTLERGESNPSNLCSRELRRPPAFPLFGTWSAREQSIASLASGPLTSHF